MEGKRGERICYLEQEFRKGRREINDWIKVKLLEMIERVKLFYYFSLLSSVILKFGSQVRGKNSLEGEREERAKSDGGEREGKRL